MLMHPQNIPDIPQQTVDVARASFPSWNIYMQIRDTLGSIFDYYAFVHLFPTNGQPAYAPGAVSACLYHAIYGEFI
jgi:transposase